MAAKLEYRVSWKREGHRRKFRSYVNRHRAELFMTLFSDDPWTYLGVKDPSASMCCSGYECACGGITHQEHRDAEQAKMPRLEYVRLEVRTVGEWKITADEKVKER